MLLLLLQHHCCRRLQKQLTSSLQQQLQRSTRMRQQQLAQAVLPCSPQFSVLELKVCASVACHLSVEEEATRRLLHADAAVAAVPPYRHVGTPSSE